MKPGLVLVDDDDTLREVLQLVLEELGYAIHSAANGPDALRLFQAHPIDLAVLDIHMPEMDGYALYIELHKLRTVPVIFISGSQGADERRYALNLGAADFLRKPFLFSDLEKSIQRALQLTA